MTMANAQHLAQTLLERESNQINEMINSIIPWTLQSPDRADLSQEIWLHLYSEILQLASNGHVSNETSLEECFPLFDGRNAAVPFRSRLRWWMRDQLKPVYRKWANEPAIVGEQAMRFQRAVDLRPTPPELVEKKEDYQRLLNKLQQCKPQEQESVNVWSEGRMSKDGNPTMKRCANRTIEKLRQRLAASTRMLLPWLISAAIVLGSAIEAYAKHGN